MCAFHDVLGFQAVRDVIFFNDYMKKWGNIYIYTFSPVKEEKAM